MTHKGLGVGALICGLVIGAGTGATASTLLDVNWGGQTQALGTLTGSGTGSDFYAYSGGTTNSGLTLELATAYAFVHESTTTGDFSFGMVFTGSNVATPRTTCAKAPVGDPSLCRTVFDGVLSGADAGSTVGVKDDLANIFGDSDRSAAGANGYYELIPFTGTTDGFVVEGISAGATLSFDVGVFENFENLVFVSGTETALVYSPFTLSGGNADLTIRIPGSGATVVPVPAGWVLMISALGLIGGLRTRSRATG